MTERARVEHDGLVVFYCPGCRGDLGHRIDPASWSWNGDTERPTISPSVLVRWGRDRVCHSFVTDGRIQFLADSTHELAGQTVALPGWPGA